MLGWRAGLHDRRAVRRVAPAAVLTACLVLAFFAVVPSAGAARHEVTRAAKVRLLRHFSSVYNTPPQLLILGSSRAMRADPAQLRKRLDVKGFNAAVSSGTIPDAYAFLRLTRHLYPNARPAVLWFLDVEVLRLGGYHPYTQSVPALRRLLPKLASPSAKASGVALAGGSAGGVGVIRPRFHPDGLLTYWWHDWQRSHGRSTAAGVRWQQRTYGAIYESRRGCRISGSARWFAREIVRQANALGVTPVIVLTPYHPQLRAFLSKHGWIRAYRRARRLLRQIDKQYDVKVIDLTFLSSFRGWASGFYDGVHPRRALMHRTMAEIADRAGNYLRPAVVTTSNPRAKAPTGTTATATASAWRPRAALSTPVAFIADLGHAGRASAGIGAVVLPLSTDGDGESPGNMVALAIGVTALAAVLWLGIERPHRRSLHGTLQARR